MIENPIDLFYLTRLSLSKGILVITDKRAELFVDGRYFEAAQKQKDLTVRLYEKNSWAKYLKGSIGFDSTFTSFAQYEMLKSSWPEVMWKPLESPLKQMRAKKNPEEIAALKRAAELTAKGIQHIKSLLKEGISEEELAFSFEFFCRKNGASGLSFDPIIAFGENSAYPHYRTGKALLKKGDIVLMDVGCVVDHYRGDLTRVEFFGKADPRIDHFFQVVKKAHDKAVQAARPGIKVGQLDRMVRDEFRKEGMEEYFLHSLGHGIGLETHEYPRLRDQGEDGETLLEPGMVVTIEPGLYQAGLGGVRYEDMILVTDQGSINLSGAAC